MMRPMNLDYSDAADPRKVILQVNQGYTACYERTTEKSTT